MPDLTSVYESFLIHAESANTTEAWFGRSKTIYSPNEQRKKKSYKEFMDTEDSEDSASHLSIPGEGHAESRPPDRHSPSPESSIFPIWLKSLPGFIRKLQSELSMAPGSLAEELWREANDPECNPEIIWDAHVRISEELCDEEEAFLRKRRPFTRAALARYLNLSEKDIHEDDVPTIAICSSGGGLRALVAGTGSYLATKEDGLFDCVTYTAGVSGSCWLQALYYSSIIGQSHARLVQHLKNRLGTHITFPPTALSLLCSAPTNRYLLSGVLEKKRGDPKADFGLVDIYGILLAARLMVPKGDLAVNEHDLKISNQRRYIDAGQNPLPIYTAVRHEVPLDSEIAKARDDKHQTLNEDAQKRVTEKAKQESWFEWFECTPYEFFSEDLGAGIPTYALGRPFVNGRTQWRENGLALPELRLPLLMGIWGSAFCATLSHYWKEIRPIIKTLAGFSESGLEAWIESQDEEMGKVHPIDPAEISNFVEGMGSRLRANVPETMTNSKTLELMDAGMSNNLPIYPLLRPGRNVDVLITFDVSADIKQENWIGVADGYVKQRGIKGWPIGAGWPREDKTIEQTTQELEAAQAASSADARAKLDKAKHASASNKQQTSEQTHISPIPGGRSTDLGYCTVWVGAAEESTSPLPSSSDSSSPSSSSPTPAGLTLIYFPLICNPSVPTLDPQAPAPPFLSTWNFVYTPDEVDRCVALARANFREGAEQTRRAIRAVYERKRGMRLTRERRLREEEEERWRGPGRGREHVGDAFS
ncbi:MAG: hypothetical protein M1821_008010 [Bathelium mastoideum]|nr:MAG: hypothetical protein M1821_008010 [Bathelium mastoideum]